jgi:hypothetical protein
MPRFIREFLFDHPRRRRHRLYDDELCFDFDD